MTSEKALELMKDLRRVIIDHQQLNNAITEKAFRAVWVQLLTYITELETSRARVAELEAAARPIPVTKRLPEINVSILARVKGRKAFMQAQLTPRNTWRVWGGEYAFDSVTHWLPMPEV